MKHEVVKAQACRKYPAVAPAPVFKPHGGEPGYDGNPLQIVELKDPDGDGKRELKVPRRVDLLEDLLFRDRIEQHHFDAGRKLQADAEAVDVGSQSEVRISEHTTTFAPSDAVLIALKRASEARARLVAAFGAMGPEAEIFAVAVLLNRTPLKTACRFVGWHDHSGVPALRLILEPLARFYGLVAVGAAKDYTER